MSKNIYKNLLTNNLIYRGFYNLKKKEQKNNLSGSRYNHHKSTFKKNGFTLIELLIVIAIIGVLSTLLMVNFIGIRQRARDANRKSDMSQIQAALEQYRADQGSYPAGLPNCGNPLTNDDGSITYMQKVPCDPLGNLYYNSGDYYYYFDNSKDSYTITACLENTSDSQGTSTTPGGSGCDTSFYYTVTNP